MLACYKRLRVNTEALPFQNTLGLWNPGKVQSQMLELLFQIYTLSVISCSSPSKVLI
jgi:actin-related protein